MHKRFLTRAGVGPQQNTHFLRRLASSGQGSYEFFDRKRQSTWRKKIDRQVHNSSQPVLGDVAVEWHNVGSRVRRMLISL